MSLGIQRPKLGTRTRTAYDGVFGSHAVLQVVLVRSLVGAVTR